MCKCLRRFAEDKKSSKEKRKTLFFSPFRKWKQRSRSWFTFSDHYADADGDSLSGEWCYVEPKDQKEKLYLNNVGME